MNATATKSDFDLVRLSNSKTAVDVCSNTIRRYVSDGLPLYRMGKAAFFSKTELASFIRTRAIRSQMEKASSQ